MPPEGRTATKVFSRLTAPGGGVASPVFVVRKPPHMAPKGSPSASPVAGSEFNRGWRWWLSIVGGLLLVLEGSWAIWLGATLVGLLGR